MLNRFRRDKPERHDYELDQVLEIASEGRKLAIYDRATGLYAYWYLQLRAEEEIARMRRSQKPLTCLSLWAPTAEASAALAIHLRDHLRPYDIAAYLNNGHYVVLLLETNGSGALKVMTRIAEEVSPEISGSVAIYPDDGATFDVLLESAKARAA